MSNMFHNCKALTFLDLRTFDTSNVTDMTGMFNGCSELTSLDVSGFDTGKVTSMASMFQGCVKITSLDVSGFDTGNVTTMANMFHLCNALKSPLDVSGFDTGKVTSMTNMFYQCINLTSLDVSGFDTQNVTTMAAMFQGCSALVDPLDVSGFNTSKVTTMASMFNSCKKISALELSSFDTQNVTTMASMFNGCSKLANIDVSGFNTQNVATMASMFQSCSTLTAITFGTNFNTSIVTNMSTMFYGCSNLTGLDLSGFETSNVTSMSYMFYGCSKLATLDISSFNTSKVTNMSSIFQNCSTLTTITFGTNFDTSNVTSMDGMFNNCTSLTSLDVSGFDTGKVTSMRNMFFACNTLSNIDTSNFNTENVITMEQMFASCSSLTRMDISSFNTNNVTNMNKLFNGCTKLKSVVFGKDFSRIKIIKGGTQDSQIFAACPNLRFADFSDVEETNLFSSTDWPTSGSNYFFKGIAPTAVIYLPNGSDGVTDVRNVVYSYGGDADDLRCPHYYSEDKSAVELPRGFKTNEATYTRTMAKTTNYGTVVLPYEFTNNASVQAFSLNTEHSKTMYFVGATSVPAHTPFFYKKKVANATSADFTMTDNNNEFGITVNATRSTSAEEEGTPYTAGSGMDAWTTKGHYVEEIIDATVDPTINTFYISSDKFVMATGVVKMTPHRVSFHGKWDYDISSASGAKLNIEIDESNLNTNDYGGVINSIDDTTLLEDKYEAEATYDALGQKRNGEHKGLNIIRMKNGKVKKVIF